MPSIEEGLTTDDGRPVDLETLFSGPGTVTGPVSAAEIVGANESTNVERGLSDYRSRREAAEYADLLAAARASDEELAKNPALAQEVERELAKAPAPTSAAEGHSLLAAARNAAKASLYEKSLSLMAEHQRVRDLSHELATDFWDPDDEELVPAVARALVGAPSARVEGTPLRREIREALTDVGLDDDEAESVIRQANARVLMVEEEDRLERAEQMAEAERQEFADEVIAEVNRVAARHGATTPEEVAFFFDRLHAAATDAGYDMDRLDRETVLKVVNVVGAVLTEHDRAERIAAWKRRNFDTPTSNIEEGLTFNGVPAVERPGYAPKPDLKRIMAMVEGKGEGRPETAAEIKRSLSSDMISNEYNRVLEEIEIGRREKAARDALRCRVRGCSA